MSGVKLLISILFFIGVIIPFQVDAATFYIDFECATTVNCGDGTATTSTFSSIDEFTEVARGAGDIAFMRRGVASTTPLNDITFTSDGTIAEPIIISADYDNLWNDFASSTQTYTVAVATSTFTASADQSDIVVGDWVYVQGDCAETYNSTSLNQCEFAYEVSAVASTSIEFYLPYKGNQTGAGNNLRIMPSNPIRGTITCTSCTFSTQSTFLWIIKGIHLRSNDLGEIISNSTGSCSVVFINIIVEGNNTSSGVDGLGDGSSGCFYYVEKSRFFGTANAVNLTDGNSFIILKDSLLSSNGAGASANIFDAPQAIISDTTFTGGDFDFGSTCCGNGIGKIWTRNLALSKSPIDMSLIPPGTSDRPGGGIYFEDLNNQINDNRFFSILSLDDSNASITSTSTIVRTGGGNSSIQIIPSTNINKTSLFNKLQLFEYPIYADTTSKTYQVFFKGGTTTVEFLTSPTNKELWIECEYWAHDTNATSTRKITKSTATVDFTTDADFDQSLSVTCQPSQAGILYLRGWYAKTKETGIDNVFFIDGTPVIQ